MSDKILFWLNTSLTSFGIAKFIKEKHECEIFAIADIVDKQKSFYEKQQLVKFQKIWYYHDHILQTKKKPDLEYLESVEQKHKINLWLLAYNERFFYKFNDFYKFSGDEILSILEQECKLFESIIDQVKPDFVIMSAILYHNDQIFSEICKSKGIKVLILDTTNVGYRWVIIDGTTNFVLKHDDTNITKSFQELQDYLKGFSPAKQVIEFKKTFQISKWNYFKAALKFLFSNNTNVNTHYSYYGRTKFRVVFKMLIYTLKKRYREFCIRLLTRQMDDSCRFIYFPLHTEQERALLIAAPFYTNQLEIIMHIAKSLPIGYKLVVKDHPLSVFRGWRSVSTYKAIMQLPNVILLHHSVNSNEIIKKCSLVITISGSSGLEAAFYGKPSIVFVNTTYSSLPSTHKLQSIEELPQAIHSSLEKQVKISDLNKYVTLINENSFECDMQRLDTSLQNYFFYSGFLADVEISIDKINSFLEENHDIFDLLANEFIKKIKSTK